MKFKRRLPRRRTNSLRKPIEVTLKIYPPLPVASIVGLRILQERLQEQFLNDEPLSVPVDWNTLTLLDAINSQLNDVLVFDIMGDE